MHRVFPNISNVRVLIPHRLMYISSKKEEEKKQQRQVQWFNCNSSELHNTFNSQSRLHDFFVERLYLCLACIGKGQISSNRNRVHLNILPWKLQFTCAQMCSYMIYIRVDRAKCWIWFWSLWHHSVWLWIVVAIFIFFFLHWMQCKQHNSFQTPADGFCRLKSKRLKKKK